MKQIGILGGMAPASTLEYYRILIELSHERLPRDEYPQIIIYSLNFKEFITKLRAGDHGSTFELLAHGIRTLEQAGADFALLASNTPHLFFEELQRRVPLPLLSIVEATLRRAEEMRLNKLGLFGTRFTMEGKFYRAAAEARGIKVAIPGAAERASINKIIMEELVGGKVLEESRAALIEIAQRLQAEEGIEALILGCTELPLILDEEALGMPVLDTTRIHAEAALKYSQG
jgi:aspartate racemase